MLEKNKSTVHSYKKEFTVKTYKLRLDAKFLRSTVSGSSIKWDYVVI